MGQSLQKITPGGNEKKVKMMDEIANKYYEDNFMDFSSFYRAVCEAIEEVNKNLGNTQFRVPKVETLKQAFDKHHKTTKGKSLTKEEFQNILQDVIMETGFTGIGAKDIILYIFGVPVTALFIKQRVVPTLPNELFIPTVTSATVFALAKLNKI